MNDQYRIRHAHMTVKEAEELSARNTEMHRIAVLKAIISPEKTPRERVRIYNEVFQRLVDEANSTDV